MGRRLKRIADLVGALLFAAIFLLFVLQVVARYVFAWPLGWPDELITVLFVWVVFWGAALMVPLSAEIRFDLIANALPPRAGRIVGAAAFAVTGLLFVAALPVGIDYLVFSHRMETPVLEIPLSVVYAPLPLFLAAGAVQLGDVVRRKVRDAAGEGA